MATAESKRRKLSPLVVVHCPECGDPRAISKRYAKSGRTRCEKCLPGPERQKLSVRYKRFWLTRFDDAEVAWMAAAIWNVTVEPEVIAAQRRILLSDVRK